MESFKELKSIVQSFIQSSLHIITKQLITLNVEIQDILSKLKNLKKDKAIKLQEELKEKQNNKYQLTLYLLKAMNSSQYLIFSLYDYEKENEIEPYNILTFSSSKNNTNLINNNRTLQLLIPIFNVLFDIRNILTDKDLYIGYAILNFLYMNKELICQILYIDIKSNNSYFILKLV